MTPKMMKAVKVLAPNKLEVQSVPVPELWDEKSILIKNERTSLCNHTDNDLLAGAAVHNGPVGTNDSKEPFTLGHEICGTVVKAGSLVKDVQVGDRVSVRGWFCSGGFAEYVMANCDYLKVPKALSADEGALLEMLAATWLMTEQVLRIGDTVCLLGFGAAGNYFLKLLKAGGATQVIVVEPHPAKRAYALKKGADQVIDPYSEDVLKKVLEYTDGKKVDVCIEASGHRDSLKIMTRMVRRLGRVGMFGVCTDETIPADLFHIHENATAIFSAGYHYDYVEHAHQKSLALVEKKVIDLSDMITHRIKIDEVPAYLKMAKECKEDFRKIMIEF